MRVMVYITAFASLCSMVAFVPLFQACNTNSTVETLPSEVVEATDSGTKDVSSVAIRSDDVLEEVKAEELDAGHEVQYYEVTEQESIDIMKDALELETD